MFIHTLWIIRYSLFRYGEVFHIIVAFHTEYHHFVRKTMWIVWTMYENPMDCISFSAIKTLQAAKSGRGCGMPMALAYHGFGISYGNINALRRIAL